MTISNEGIQGGLELLARIIARKVIAQESPQSALALIIEQGKSNSQDTILSQSRNRPQALNRMRKSPEAVNQQ